MCVFVVRLIACIAFGIAAIGAIDANALALTGVKSRKVHSAAGTFDLTIDTTQAFGASVTVEPRTIGSGHVIVFQFDSTITATGTPISTDGFGPVGSVSAAITGASNTPTNNEVSITLTGISDNKRVSISLSQVNGVFDVPPVSIGFLVGDVNNTRTANSSDISSVKVRSGQPTAAASFVFDLNASGAINASDISAVKARSGLTLSSPTEVSLIVSKLGTGVGNISSTPPAINCGNTCAANFTRNTSITLTATANTGTNFTGWSGACTGTSATSVFVLATSSSCQATFAINTYTVTPSAGTNGTISPSAAQTINPGATATFTVTPVAGFYSSVSGTCGGVLNGTTYTTNPVTAPCTVDATFYPWPVWSSVIPVVPTSTTGKTVYVDGTNGANTNNGTTPATAYKTLAKAMSVLLAGDTVLIRQGFYREPLDLLAGNVPTGTATNPITFGSYGDGEVIIDGSTKVTGWTLVSGTVWQAPKTFNPVGIVVNEVPLRQVRQGQNGSTAPQDGLAGVTSGSGKWFNGTTVITADMGTTIGTGDPNLADIVVPSDNGGQQHVYFYQHAYVTFKGLTVRGSGNAGIWGYGSNITIESCNIKFNGKAGVDFEFDGTPGKTNADNAVLTSNIYHNVLKNWPRGNNGYQEAGGGWPGAIGWGFQLRPLARGNIVHMNGGEGIITYGSRTGRVSGSALFEQNVAYDNWSINMYFDNQPNNVARNNFLYNHPTDNNNFLYVGAFPYNAPGKFTGCMMLADEQNSSDGGNGYANLDGTQVYNNIMAGCRFGIRDYSEGVSAIANHGIKNTVIVNNTIIMPFNPIPNTSTFGILLQDNTSSGTQRNTNSIIQNNIIYGYNNDAVIFTQLNGAQTGVNINNNMYFSGSTAPFGAGFNTVSSYDFAGWKVAITGADTNSFFADPQFVDVTQFRAAAPAPYLIDNANLGPTSPARNAGTPQSFLPTVNFNLTPRAGWNIGAF